MAHIDSSRSGVTRWRTVGMISTMVCALSACGGGGGGATTTASPNTAPITNVPTSLASFTPTGSLPQNYLAMQAVPFASIQTAALGLPASSRPSYLKIWMIDPSTQEPVLLSLGVWDPNVAPPPIHPPRAVTVIHYEIYNDAGSVTGEWSLS